MYVVLDGYVYYSTAKESWKPKDVILRPITLEQNHGPEMNALQYCSTFLGRSDPPGDNLALASHPRIDPDALILYCSTMLRDLSLIRCLFKGQKNLDFH